jgi:hypothetical protein
MITIAGSEGSEGIDGSGDILHKNFTTQRINTT